MKGCGGGEGGFCAAFVSDSFFPSLFFDSRDVQAHIETPTWLHEYLKDACGVTKFPNVANMAHLLLQDVAVARFLAVVGEESVPSNVESVDDGEQRELHQEPMLPILSHLQVSLGYCRRGPRKNIDEFEPLPESSYFVSGVTERQLVFGVTSRRKGAKVLAILPSNSNSDGVPYPRFSAETAAGFLEQILPDKGMSARAWGCRTISSFLR